MSEIDNSKQEEAETEKPSLEPPEPEISTTTTIREDQVQNAVAFLSHPKVTSKLFPLLTNAHGHAQGWHKTDFFVQVHGSTTESKKSFLQKKGLTEAEITDAFKRVPEASDTTVGTPAAASSTTGQLAQVTRPQKPFPTAAPASGQYQPAHGQPQALQPQQALQPASYRWSQVSGF